LPACPHAMDMISIVLSKGSIASHGFSMRRTAGEALPQALQSCLAAGNGDRL
jgi:hypothetical protein